MAFKRWISAAWVAASSVMLPGPLARCQVPAPASAPAPAAAPAPDVPADPAVLVERDLTALYNRLIDPAPAGPRDIPISQQREEDARRLVSRQSPGALQFLLNALGNPVSRQAVVRAIANDPQPDASFINPLLGIVGGGGDRALSDDVARALARFGNYPDARDRLIAFAQDLNQPASLRVGVVRALGDIVNRDVADALIAILNDPRQTAAVQNAAAEALAKLTGDWTRGRDGQAWKAWQAARANLKDPEWQGDVLAARENRRVQDEHGKDELINELKRINDEILERADRDGRTAIIMRLLNSPEARVRLLGVQKVADALVNSKFWPPAARKRLVDMVGDSDPDVRKEVAGVIQTLEIDALEPLLAQVAQEPRIDVKLAQIAALVHMKRLRVIPTLQQLLRDPSMQAAIAAVNGIKDLGQTLRDQGANLVPEIAKDVWNVGVDRAAQPGGEAFRAATIEAVGALHDRAMTRDVLDLLNLNNSPLIRSAALHALADLGDQQTSFRIAQWLQVEPVAAVRIDAIKAYGATSTFEGAAETLYKYMSPETETDPAVRERAWLEFQSLLPRANNLRVLAQWATTFQNDPTRRLAVLLQLNSKYRQELKWDDLAESQQNTGDTYMKPPLSDPTKAAIEFQAALDYWQKRGVANQVTVVLVPQLFSALFAARDFDKAASIAGKQIARDRTQQGVVVRYFTEEIDRLYTEGARDNDQQKLKDGLRLSEAALKIQPPLDDRFLTDLQQYKQSIELKLKK